MDATGVSGYKKPNSVSLFHKKSFYALSAARSSVSKFCLICSLRFILSDLSLNREYQIQNNINDSYKVLFSKKS